MRYRVLYMSPYTSRRFKCNMNPTLFKKRAIRRYKRFHNNKNIFTKNDWVSFVGKTETVNTDRFGRIKQVGKSIGIMPKRGPKWEESG